jgi:ABC-type phosphate transport system permease subunit
MPDSLYAPSATIASVVANSFPEAEPGYAPDLAVLLGLGFILFVVSFGVLALRASSSARSAWHEELSPAVKARYFRRQATDIIMGGLCMAAAVIGLIMLALILWMLFSNGPRRPLAGRVHQLDGSTRGRRRSRQRHRGLAHPGRHRRDDRRAARHDGRRLPVRSRQDLALCLGRPLRQRHPALGAVGADRPVRLPDRGRALGRLLRASPAHSSLALLAMPSSRAPRKTSCVSCRRLTATAPIALGSRENEVVRKVVLPAAFGGILTGILLAVARIAGETAPLLIFTSLGNSNWSTDLTKPMASLPIAIYRYAGSPTRMGFQLAWTGAC